MRPPRRRGSTVATGIAAVLLVSLLVAGCGFRPLYGDRGAASTGARLASVALTTEPDRLGQHLYRLLADELDIAAAPDFQLSVDLESAQSEVVIGIDSRVRRFDVTVAAHYILSAVPSSARVHEGRTSALASYNVVDSDFATEIARRDAEARAVSVLAREIVLQLALLFDRGVAQAR